MMVIVLKENIQTMEKHQVLALLLVVVAQAGIKQPVVILDSAVIVPQESTQVSKVVQYVQRARRAPTQVS